MPIPVPPYLITIFRWSRLLVRSFLANNCPQRAAALSYTTILSLVPFFALAFALLKGFGVPNKLAPIILEQVAAGSQETVGKILTYINNTNMKSLGVIGLATLILTVLSLLSDIEEAFNAIWGVKETRPWARKFSDYLSVVMSGPLLLIAATSITTTLQSQVVVKELIALNYIGPVIYKAFLFIPYLSIWVALVFLYLFMPNTRVRFSSALIGGMLAGALWQGAQWAYIHLQISVASYNAIYGTLAVLPVFMVWIYSSWVIVLLGVEIVYAHQHHALLQGGPLPALSDRQHTALCLSLAAAAARRFAGTEPAPTDEILADEVGVPLLQARELLNVLITTGILVRTAGAQPTYLPAHDPGTLWVSDLIQTIANAGSSTDGTVPDQLTGLFTALDQAATEQLAGLSLAALATGIRYGQPVPAIDKPAASPV